MTLLGWVVSQVDLSAVGQQVVSFGALGLAVVLAIYLIEFTADAAAWNMTLSSVSANARWLRRLFFVRLVGEAFNVITPLGGMGGEPIKVLLLKSRYQIGYREATASLVLVKTTTLISLVMFLLLGFWILLRDPRFPSTLKLVAGVGLVVLAGAVLAFFLVQRLRVPSRIGGRLDRLRGRPRVEAFLVQVRAFDEQLAGFYAAAAGRFAAAVLLGLLNWLAGMLSVYWTMRFLGAPVSYADAWLIESIAQLVRASTFFIPASIGAQEGAFAIMLSVILGDPAIGLAAALVRRFREITWIVMGLVVGWGMAVDLRDPRESG